VSERASEKRRGEGERQIGKPHAKEYAWTHAYSCTERGFKKQIQKRAFDRNGPRHTHIHTDNQISRPKKTSLLPDCFTTEAGLGFRVYIYIHTYIYIVMTTEVGFGERTACKRKGESACARARDESAHASERARREREREKRERARARAREQRNERERGERDRASERE